LGISIKIVPGNWRLVKLGGKENQALYVKNLVIADSDDTRPIYKEWTKQDQLGSY
jgi:hypothetical protein